jgi:hypothetical protein
MTRLAPFLIAAAFLLSGPAWAAKDSDGDGVRDRQDACPGQDDRVDLDDNGVPDCLETRLAAASFEGREQGLAWEDDLAGHSAASVSFVDAQGYLYSGSMDLELSGPFDTATAGSSFSACVEVQPGSTQLVMAQLEIRSEGAGELRLLEYADLVDCLGREELRSAPLARRQGSTQGFVSLGGEARLSTRTHYARVELHAEKSQAQTVSTRWDNVLVKPLVSEPALASAD